MKSGGFNQVSGPWFLKDEEGRLVGGFRVLPHHLNPNGVCHGGLLATFFDVFLAMAAIYQGELVRAMLPTISLSLDFLEPTPGDAWVEARAEVLRIGRRMVFMQGLASVDGRPTVRADGVFSIPSAETPGRNTYEGLRRLLWSVDTA